MALTALVDATLPALSGSSVNYNKEHNIYLTDGYTSAAGNTYFQGIRLNDRLIVKYNFGQGYCYLFLNGISLYCYDGTEKKLISSQSYYCRQFSEGYARQECCRMLKDFLGAQVKMLGQSVSDRELEEFAKEMVRTVLDNKPQRLIR